MLDLVVLFLSGILGGFFAGFLGIGGGLVYILILPPALSHFGIPSEFIPRFVIANSLLGVLFASFSGNIVALRKKSFYSVPTCWVGAGALLSSVAVLYLVVYRSWYQEDKFSYAVLAILFYILLHTWLKRKEHGPDQIKQSERMDPGRLLLSGVLGGSAASLTGLGGGVLLIPTMRSLSHFDIMKAKSISLGVIFIISLGTSLSNLFEPSPVQLEVFHQGLIVFPVVAPLILGVVIGSPLGVKISLRVKSLYISYTFATFVLVLILKYVYTLI
ncbi:MAG: sulfite exporter TauE/SafE family protein [Cytophagales bacterium]|nr:sulfite exporter TauE/SafE family protein [Cytophagales bacterium]